MTYLNPCGEPTEHFVCEVNCTSKTSVSPIMHCIWIESLYEYAIWSLVALKYPNLWNHCKAKLVTSVNNWNCLYSFILRYVEASEMMLMISEKNSL